MSVKKMLVLGVAGLAAVGVVSAFAGGPDTMVMPSEPSFQKSIYVEGHIGHAQSNWGGFMSYKLRNDNVIWDAMSPKNIIIADLEKGYYTTLFGEGAEFLWNLLINAIPLDKIVDICHTQFKSFGENEVNVIKHITSNLQEADILTETPDSNNYQPLLATLTDGTPVFDTFQVTLTRYDDMQMLLQLDPIDNVLAD